jgi:hypothetical protein
MCRSFRTVNLLNLFYAIGLSGQSSKQTSKKKINGCTCEVFLHDIAIVLEKQRKIADYVGVCACVYVSTKASVEVCCLHFCSLSASKRFASVFVLFVDIASPFLGEMAFRMPLHHRSEFSRG